MAGHSKWANIRFRKGAQDAKRGKLFTKLIREITVASRMSGPDPANNPRLRTAMDKGLGNNMPKDTIERAIKRGSGDLEGIHYEEVRYEGYGPGGAAVMVDCMTDNRNRTVADIRHAFSKCGGNLGTDGSVRYLFQKMGMLTYSSEFDEERIMEAALEAGAEDIVTEDDGTIEVITNPEKFEKVRQTLIEQSLPPENAEIDERAATHTTLNDKDGVQMVRLLEMLEDHDDVQSIHSNADIPAAMLAGL